MENTPPQQSPSAPEPPVVPPGFQPSPSPDAQLAEPVGTADAVAWDPSQTPPEAYPSAVSPEAAETAAPTAVETTPAVRWALRKDMAKLAGVFLAAVILMQFVVPIVFTAIVIFTDPNILKSIMSGTPDPQAIQKTVTDTIMANSGVLSLIGAALACLLYLFIRGRRLFTTDISTTVPVGSRWGLLAKMPLLMFGVAGTLGLVGMLIQAITGHDPSAAESTIVGSATTTVLGMTYAVVIGPFIEEVVFRGAIMRFLMPYGINFAIVTQALLFGLYHMNFWQSLFAFCVGLVLGYVAARFSLKWAVALHILNNGLSMLAGTYPTVSTVLTVAYIVCAAGALFVIIKDRASLKPLILDGRSTVVAQPYRTGWTQPFFLIVMVVLFIIGLAINTAMMLSVT